MVHGSSGYNPDNMTWCSSKRELYSLNELLSKILYHLISHLTIGDGGQALCIECMISYSLQSMSHNNAICLLTTYVILAVEDPIE